MTAILIGGQSVFAEGVAAILRQGQYVIRHRLAACDDAAIRNQAAAARLLIVIVRRGPMDVDGTCSEIKAMRAVVPRAKIMVVRETHAAVVADLGEVDADAYVQCMLEPQALLDIAALILSGSYRVFVTSPALERLAACEAHDWTTRHPVSHTERRTPASIEHAYFAATLSKREREVLNAMAKGETNKAMGRRFNVSEATIKAHVRSVLQKIGAANRTQAAVMLMESGIATRAC